MSQTINIPVMCIGEACRNCEDIEIDKERDVKWGDCKLEYANNIYYCKHYRRCEIILENLRENGGDKK